MNDDFYIEVLKKNLAKAQATLQSLKEEAEKIKKEYGVNHWKYHNALERVSIASENIVDQQFFLDKGVPRSPIQSVAIPNEFLDKLQ